MQSIFKDQRVIPGDKDLKVALGSSHALWISLLEFMRTHEPNTQEAWYYSGDKYGWNYRVRDQKRVLIYFLPRDNFFKVAFVFGEKAVDQIAKSDISNPIIEELMVAKKYSEGRGIRIEVKDSSVLSDVQKLIRIKVGV